MSTNPEEEPWNTAPIEICSASSKGNFNYVKNGERFVCYHQQFHSHSRKDHTFCLKIPHEYLQSLLETEKPGVLTVYF